MDVYFESMSRDYSEPSIRIVAGESRQSAFMLGRLMEELVGSGVECVCSEADVFIRVPLTKCK